MYSPEKFAVITLLLMSAVLLAGCDFNFNSPADICRRMAGDRTYLYREGNGNGTRGFECTIMNAAEEEDKKQNA